MLRRLRVSAWLIGIAVLGTSFQAGSAAYAKGLMVSGGGIKVFGDPFYEYVVELNLLPGYSFTTFDYFKLEALPGVQYPNSLTGSPNPGDPIGPWGATVTNLPDGPLPGFPAVIVPFADVQFTNFSNAGGPPVTIDNVNGSQPAFLGQFDVITAVSLPELPATYSLTVDWVGIVQNAQGQTVDVSGTVTLHLIPEPASLLLMGVGLGLPLCWHIHRRRRAIRATQL